MSFFDTLEEALDFALAMPGEVGSIIYPNNKIWMFDPEELKLARVEP
ncbi:MAG: hypothetical protein QIT40_gp29 [Lokiarchaeia virus VerdaV4]|uniref:Uncharacterized protein n=1 Tax=Lokiarchaeia virus VerdaV4 TaxID=3070172 RepID=A0AA35CRE0_9CAUD|nr:MAG: hypothetical protein QIT40_gp29 [Lokiarchaeia virus VerdaV4]BDI54987.1 MAG: hypothetical protein [Lokiarchaeia virus VerdaV4]